MKAQKPIASVLLLIVLLAGAGCHRGDVQMRGEYPQLLADTAAWSAEVADRAEADKLTKAEMATILGVQAQLWQQFLAASQGRRVQLQPAETGR
jgi:hypothetical protein